MKEGDLVKPYVFSKLPEAAEFRFTPQYNPLSVVLKKAAQLFKAHTSNARRRPEILAAIAKEHQDHECFDSSWLEDLNEKILIRSSASQITPLVSNPGRVVLTNSVIYFQPFNNVEAQPVKKFRLSGVLKVANRRYLLRQVGIEIFMDDAVLFLAFESEQERDQFEKLLLSQSLPRIETQTQGNMMLMWQSGKLSNYDYLMYLNTMADRSFNDLMQYPVFPWVIADYKSPTLDLSKPATFRNLSKPIGALNPARLAGLKERYNEMPAPKFLYGTHYSTPGYVLFYTVRQAPEYTLCLQAGKYDHADRMFRSIEDTWQNVTGAGADVKELIPEFYQPGGEFLLNSKRLDLGSTQETGEAVGDVRLPPWASSAADFTAKCREALECEYVSTRIHDWIDLIFGYKQRGPEAVKADNVFYYLTYEGAVDVSRLADPLERESVQAQIMEFGQTPKQLFTIPHPARLPGATTASGNSSNGVITAPVVASSTEVVATMSGDLVGEGEEHELVSTSPAKQGTISEATNADPRSLTPIKNQSAHSWTGLTGLTPSFLERLHRDTVTGVAMSSDWETLYSVSEDGALKVYSLSEQRQVHSVVIGDMALSSVAVLDDATTVMVGSWDNNVYWYNIEYGRVMTTHSGHDDAVSQAVKVGDALVTCSWDTTMKVWDYVEASTGARRRPEDCLREELNDLEGEVHFVTVNSDRGLIAAGGASDGKVVVWSLTDFSVVQDIEAHEDLVYDAAFSPDGHRVMTCGNDGMLKVFGVSRGEEIDTVDVGTNLRCLQFDGQIAVAGADDGSLQIWDVVQRQKLFSGNQHTAAIRSIRISPCGRRVVTGGEDCSICVWEVGK